MNTLKLGERMSECASCHRYFTTTANFDKHRAWDGDRRICNEPADVGLHYRDNGAWGSPPMTDEQKRQRGWVA